MARDIDVAGAEAALEAANIDPTNVQAQNQDPFAVAPPAAPEAAPEAPAAPVAVPDAPAATEAAKTPEDLLREFSSIPDEVLSPEVLQMKKALQADYTKGQQESAPWRKLAGDLGVESPEDLKAVIDTARQLQDPNNWEQLHSELTSHLMATGRLTQGQAQAKATEQMAAFTPAEPADDGGLAALGLDPDDTDPVIAQLAQQVASLTKQVQSDAAARSQFEAQQAQQREYDALASSLTQTETALRAANPAYTDETIGTIYRFLDTSDMDLNKAHAEFQSEIGREVARILQSKGTTAQAVPTPIQGGGTTTEQEHKPLTREEGHQAAMAWAAAADQSESGMS